MHTPKIVESATESGANVFGLDYFGRPAYLAQSPQFYKQAMVGVFERVYEVGPVFRAEPHDTARHLAQYTSLDAEFGFIARPPRRDGGAARGDRGHGGRRVRERAAAAVATLGADAARGARRDPGVHFADAQELIATPAGTRAASRTCPPPTSGGCREWALREHGSEFLFVTGYPMAKRPFYTHPDPAQARLLQQLRPAVPRAGAGDRRPAAAPARATTWPRWPSAARTAAPYAGYLQVFAHGMPPHGGFAIGLERWTARLTGAANIRQVTAVPARPAPALSP